MQANKHVAFGGRVVFCTRPTNLRTTLEYSSLDKMAQDITHGAKEAPGMVMNLLYYIACTESIEFDFQGNETALLTEFKTMWEGLRPYTVESITRALDWLLDGSTDIRNEWDKSIETANALWIDPTIAPVSALTPEQQKEAADPESPLPLPAKKRGQETLSA